MLAAIAATAAATAALQGANGVIHTHTPVSTARMSTVGEVERALAELKAARAKLRSLGLEAEPQLMEGVIVPTQTSALADPTLADLVSARLHLAQLAAEAADRARKAEVAAMCVGFEGKVVRTAREEATQAEPKANELQKDGSIVGKAASAASAVAGVVSNIKIDEPMADFMTKAAGAASAVTDATREWLKKMRTPMKPETSSVDSWYDSGIRLTEAEKKFDLLKAEGRATIARREAMLAAYKQASTRSSAVQSWYDAGVRLEPAPPPVATAEPEVVASSSLESVRDALLRRIPALATLFCSIVLSALGRLTKQVHAIKAHYFAPSWPAVGGGGGYHRMAGRWPPRAPA